MSDQTPAQRIGICERCIRWAKEARIALSAEEEARMLHRTWWHCQEFREKMRAFQKRERPSDAR